MLYELVMTHQVSKGMTEHPLNPLTHGEKHETRKW